MIRVLATFFILIAFCASFGCTNPESRTIADVTRAETLMFKAPQSSGIHAIVINVGGFIEGNAEVQLILNGTVYQRRNVSGRFAAEISSDWYSQEAEVRYVPESVTKGNVAVKVRFLRK